MKFKVTAVLAAFLLVVIPAVGQNSGNSASQFVVQFNSTTYDDPAFSALFPVGAVAVSKQNVAGRDISQYSVSRGKEGEKEPFLFEVGYWDAPTTETPVSNAAYLDGQFDLFHGTGGGRADSTLGGLFARSSWSNEGIDHPPSYEQYNRITVKGRRVWWALVKCADPWFASCAEGDVNKFFDSIKIK